MEITIVIVNYNVQYFLEQCLISVQRAIVDVQAEVYVVDNNSVDGSVAMVQHKFPWVKLIANEQNTGFSRANNQAMRLAKGEHVLLLNPDTVIEEDTLLKVLAFMKTHPECGGLGVKMVDGKGVFLPESKRGLPTPETAFYKIVGFSRLFPKSKKFNRYYLGHLSNTEVHEIEILSGLLCGCENLRSIKWDCWTKHFLCTAKTSIFLGELFKVDSRITTFLKQVLFITKERARRKAA
jgi:GT2 family glycosyltransferase